jgi:hypothetical protein
MVWYTCYSSQIQMLGLDQGFSCCGGGETRNDQLLSTQLQCYNYVLYKEFQWYIYEHRTRSKLCSAILYCILPNSVYGGILNRVFNLSCSFWTWNLVLLQIYQLFNIASCKCQPDISFIHRIFSEVNLIQCSKFFLFFCYLGWGESESTWYLSRPLIGLL